MRSPPRRQVGGHEQSASGGGPRRRQGDEASTVDYARPKPLLPVLGRPCVEYVIEAMAEAGVEEVFLTCGYRAEDMVEALGSGDQFGVEIIMCFEDVPAGTAGAVKLLEDRLEDTFIVASGDVLADVDVRSLVDQHVRTGAMATMALTTVERPEEFGIVGLDDAGRIERFKEKPRTEEVFSNLINAGIYVLERDVLPEIPRGEMYDFSKQLFPKLLAAGQPLYGAAWGAYGRTSAARMTCWTPTSSWPSGGGAPSRWREPSATGGSWPPRSRPAAAASTVQRT